MRLEDALVLITKNWGVSHWTSTGGSKRWAELGGNFPAWSTRKSLCSRACGIFFSCWIRGIILHRWPGPACGLPIDQERVTARTSQPQVCLQPLSLLQRGSSKVFSFRVFPTRTTKGSQKHLWQIFCSHCHTVQVQSIFMCNQRKAIEPKGQDDCAPGLLQHRRLGSGHSCVFLWHI